MPPALSRQIDETERLAPSRGDAMQISREQGQLLASIALALDAKRVIEVGTSYGFSGLWWLSALSLTNGHLVTIDVSEKKYRQASRTFQDAGVLDRVSLHLGRGIDVIPTIEGTFDIAFIDADKPATQEYFNLLWPRIRRGGAIVTDNVLSHQQEMGNYLNSIRSREDAHSVTIPIRAGLEWTLKIA
jgi:predicted O-methyltransferase YrrM